MRRFLTLFNAGVTLIFPAYGIIPTPSQGAPEADARPFVASLRERT